MIGFMEMTAAIMKRIGRLFGFVSMKELYKDAYLWATMEMRDGYTFDALDVSRIAFPIVWARGTTTDDRTGKHLETNGNDGIKERVASLTGTEDVSHTTKRDEGEKNEMHNMKKKEEKKKETKKEKNESVESQRRCKL